MKYAHLNNKKLLGWYDSQIHDNISNQGIEVTNEIWQNNINNGANAFVNGNFIHKNFSTEIDKKRQRIIELKNKLAETNYKDLPSYDKKSTIEWEQLIVQRQEWREEIRSLGG